MITIFQRGRRHKNKEQQGGTVFSSKCNSAMPIDYTRKGGEGVELLREGVELKIMPRFVKGRAQTIGDAM
jgi:hypothetical protein